MQSQGGLQRLINQSQLLILPLEHSVLRYVTPIFTGDLLPLFFLLKQKVFKLVVDQTLLCDFVFCFGGSFLVIQLLLIELINVVVELHA